MHTITAAIARARIDDVFRGHQLTPAECVELSTLLDRNDASHDGLLGQDRERFVELLDRATDPYAPYPGPDERQ